MRLAIASTVFLLGASSAFASPHIHRGPTSPHASHAHAAVASRTHAVAHVQGIAPERATEIQTALIKAGYLTGSPTGEWDTQTQAAMEKMQADNGWQTKLVPDSRAIIKLGLGPGSKPQTVVAAAPSVEAAAPELTVATPANQ